MNNIETYYPVTPLQQGLIFHSLLEPESGAYIVQMGLKLQGPLNVSLFEQAWQCLVDRHAIFRTRFVGGKVKEYVQVVLKELKISVVEHDLLHLSSSEQEAFLHTFAKEDRKRGFNVEQAPLMRLNLFHLGSDTVHFLWTLHHVLIDGWSMPLVFGEVFAAYDMLSKGEPVQLPPVRAYRDYILWLKKQDLKQAEAFWRNYLQGFAEATPLSFGRAYKNPYLDQKQYRELDLTVSEPISRALQTLARQHRLTVNTIVQGAWALLLSRYSGQDDIVFGATVSGRPADLPGVETMIGLFINTLPVRVQIRQDESVISWLKSLQQQQAEFRQYEYTPLVEIQGWSDVPRGQSLFESILVFENTPVGQSGGGGESAISIVDVHSEEQTNYPFTLVAASGKTIDIKVKFDESQFELSAIERVLDQLHSLLVSIAKNARQRLADVSLISESERHQVLVEWNRTAVEYPTGLCVHHAFERQVEKTPNTVAVAYHDVELTYAQLNERANQLAHRLVSEGVKPDTLVGICTERSPDMIIAILGVMKSGAAYVPIDPAHPRERIAYMIADSQARVLLTQQSLIEMLPETVANVICLDSDELADEPVENVASEATERNLAYVIYTSGSTGQPKGVMVEHHSVMNMAHALIEAFDIQPTSRVLQFTSFSFDVSISEIAMALLAGATLVIADRESLMPGPELIHVLREQRITAVSMVSSVLAALPDAELPDLRTLIVGGEAPSRELVARYAPGRRFFNCYGPTEATVCSTMMLCQPGMENPPIGRPIANATMYVLDANLQPVPVGVPGELYIGGKGLARGYWNRPELTAERFIAHPFGAEGERLYRTGDLVRYRQDGNLEFLGRIDHQVKIRGYRIELGEIENALRQHPAVQEALVIAREEKAGDKRLAAYLVAATNEEKPAVEELAFFLKETLPDYMIPAGFVWLDAIPLTVNGKVDRRALPVPDWGQLTAQREYIAPRTPTEEIVANIWSQVLSVERVGSYDDFFELGGHSLLATQTVSRLKEAFGVEIPLRTLFEFSTVNKLSEWIASVSENKSGLSDIPLVPVARDRNLPLSYAQQRLWFFDRLMPNHALYNIPTAVQLQGKLDIDAWERSLKLIIDRHESLRTTFTDQNGEAVQVIHPTSDWRLERIDLRALPDDVRHAEGQRLAKEEANKPFDLVTGPLIRATIIQTGEENFIFLLNVHHIIADGWSAGILLRELFTCYQAFVQGETPKLAELPIQYADYAVWQREWLTSDVLEKQLSYWRAKLGGAEPLLALPTDRPRPAVQTYEGSSITVMFDEELKASLFALSKREGTTLFMTLLAAFQVFLYRYTGQDDILVGTPEAGRSRQETEGLIGFFINTLVMRTDLSGEPSFKEVLARVRETALGAYAHQDLPFEKLVDELQLERSLSYSPLFQVMFVLQNIPVQAEALEGIRILPLEGGQQVETTKFDLTLTMAEAPSGLAATFEYNTALFDRSTVERMIGHFGRLLEAVAANPNQAITTLPLMSEAEQQRVVSEWNNTAVAYSTEHCVHELVAQIARKLPDQPAVVTKQQSVTYAELEAKANQLAHYLQKQGVGQGSLVGICVERSIEMVIGQLAIIKAGGAYVPMDPAYPKDRLAFMVQDAGMAIVLTQERLTDKLPAGASRLICLDADWDAIAREQTTAPASAASVNDLAYVIYTSGSTGTPKGVEIEHAALLNLIFWHQRAYQVTAKDRASQIAGTAFDASVWEIWPYLTKGATLYLPEEEIRLVPEKLRDWLVDCGITISFLPTPLTESMLALEWPDHIALRYMLTGGDKLHHYPSDKLPFTLVNQYGPTENTVVATAGIVPKEAGQAAAPTIGRPIDNVQVYVLDAHMQPVPVGVSGELYIGGSSLARGYLNRPELTQERFVAHPFSEAEGARLYRTGDLVRYLPDGSLEFIGRTDDQTSIRGFRVELGEVETAIVAHPAVKEAVVTVCTDKQGTKRLAAYLVLEEGTALATNDIRKALKEALPDYMVPAFFIEMPYLPLTPNGKVDRKSLPAPDFQRPELAGEFVPPSTEKEQRLAAIWKDVLGIEQIGIHDNFFELGGDSILSIQIVSRANQAGLTLTPKQLFEYQTIAELAQVVEEKAAVQAEQGPITGEVPLLPIQKWFFVLPLENRDHWNQSVLLSIRAGIDQEALRQAVGLLLSHHDALRMRYTQTENGWLQQMDAPSETIPFRVEDLSQLAQKEQARAVEAIANQTQANLSLAEGRVVQTVYFHLGKDVPGRLLIVAHHLAVDGVSWRIILEDLQNAYEQIAAGREAKLPAKTTSYKQWAHELARYAQSDALEHEKRYWLSKSSVDSARLPVDTPDGGENTEATAKSVQLSLTVEETRALLQHVPQLYRTQINDVLLTALAKALGRWTGKRSVFVNVEGHGREELAETIDLSRTVGWFTSMYPVHLQWDETFSVKKALLTTKEELRAIPNKGLGYGVLRYLHADREVAEALDRMQAEVLFNYMGKIDQIVGADSLFGSAPESSGANLSPDAQWHHLIDVNSVVAGEQLHVTWRFSEKLHRESTIAAVATDFMAALREIVAHCATEEAGGYSPSDFPLAVLDQKSIDKHIGSDRHIEDVYTLSPLQQGMLFHSLYSQDSGDYVVQFAVTFHNLDVSVLEKAWQKVLDRHSILRTYFVWEGLNQPHQVVRKDVKAVIREEDWRHLPAEVQEEKFAAFLAQDRRQSFDITQAPLSRWVVFRTGEAEYRFVWSFHHVLLDGWSVPIVLNELLAHYTAISEGQEEKRRPSQPFSHYIAWLKRQDMQKARQFWMEQLKGFHEPTPLGMGKAAVASTQKQYREKSVLLSEEASEQLHSFVREHQLTLNTLVQGAWGWILGSYSGEEEVLFGATGSGRPADLAGVETMVGSFINTLPVRIFLRTDATVLAWLKDLQRRQLEIREYEYTPLFDIQSWSELPRGSALFESILVFENYPTVQGAKREEGNPDSAASGVSLEIHDVTAVEQTNYPLTLVAAPGKQVAIKLKYDQDRFDDAMIDRVLQQMIRLMVQMSETPKLRLADITLMDDEERKRVLVDWNRTEADYPRELCIHQAFERQAEKTPEHAALEYKGQTLTYAGLNQRANQLARLLLEKGAKPDTTVAICTERSMEMIVGILGVLKAGAAYVPIDPAHPEERIAYMLEDSQAVAVLTQEGLADMFSQTAASVICLDAESLYTDMHSENVHTDVQSTNLAYVIYTSGTTGQPKGVAVEHRSVMNMVHAYIAYFGLNESSRVLQFTSFSFDVSVSEIFQTLLSGGTLVIEDRESLLPGPDLVRTLRERRISKVSMASSVLASLPVAEYPDLTVIEVGGDACSRELVARYAAGRKFFNCYGPTEATVGTIIKQLSDADDAPTIGRPFPNTKLYVLDRQLQPVPVGVPGELYIGGECLARGYWNRPELTKERFIANPFGQPGERLYRTGDLVRYLPDGTVDYLGRLDDQVKIRGYRIELDEIAEALRQHQAVKEAVVLARKARPGDKRLAAYLTSHSGQEVSADEIKRWLKDKLPEYMIPACYTWLPAIPLTVNGKVDRKALPAPDWGQLASEYVVPRNPLEEMVANVFAEVLAAEKVGINDNFFELGGHSLLATQTVSRLRELVGVELQLRTLFEHPTVAELGEQLALLTAQTSRELAPPIVQVSRKEPLPLSFTQQRLWFMEQFTQNGSVNNIPSFLRIQGELDVAAWEASFRAIIERHESLRTNFEVRDGRPVQVIRDHGEWAMNRIDLREMEPAEREAEVKRLAEQAILQPFDMAKGPLLRASLVQQGEKDFVFLLVMHHIVSDGWSMGILLRELLANYKAFSQGEASPLPQLPIQYADFAVWQREWLSGEVLAEQLHYWREKLKGSEPLLQLPTDRPRPPVQTYEGEKLSVQFDAELLEQLQALSRKEGATLFMTLLAAFQTLLYRYSNQEDILVGTPIAGRNKQETEQLIGYFINTLVMRTDMAGQPSFRVLLARVRETALEAYAHQDVPFEKLLDELQLERSMSYSPLFQVMFILQNIPVAVEPAGDIQLSSFDIDMGAVTSKFDLTMTMVETADGLLATVEYNKALFDKATIARMVNHFHKLMEEIVANPDQSITLLPLMREEEEQLLITEWNRTEVPYSREKCVHEMIEEMAAKAPDSVALIVGEQRVTYGELNKQANKLAHYLRKQGVGPEVLVGICAERTVEMMIGLLAILKAGGAYVPIDPAYPAERIAYIIEHSRIPLLLTQEKLLPTLPAHEAQVICLDSDWEAVAHESEQNPGKLATSDNLIYVIYTSGSTGNPKGVALEHRSVIYFLRWAHDTFTPEEMSGVLFSTSICFDLSVYEMFATLTMGGKVIMAENALHLPTLPAADEVTLINTVPSAAAELVRMKGIPSSVRVVNLCGEPLSNKLAQELYTFPHVEKVVNLYGPTEDTVYSTHAIVEKGATSEPLIGRPQFNTQVFVLDRHRKPVPVGVPGELYLSGSGLARGYLHRPDLTAERFVQNPFREPGVKMYRTGDLVRYLPDGNLQFVGRVDYQVKIRGYRIELGEIESVLNRFPGVKEVVLLAREDREGDKCLVAYVVFEADCTSKIHDLNRFLADKLPAYMLPQHYMILDSLPRTPNGKLDRKALPKPEYDRAEADVEYVAPQTPVEIMLHAHWAAVLEMDKIGVHDNFFEIGGHSLLATQLIFRVREELALEVPLRILFENPTIAGMARTIEEIIKHGLSSVSDEIDAKDLQDEVVLDPAIQAEQPYKDDPAQFQAALLTGATGFLGAFLLRDLLRMTDADIYCLVRAANAEEAMARLRKTLELYELWDEYQAQRIIPVVGDLAQPRLGLTDEQFAELAEKVDVVYHNGALVNFVYPYAALKKANVKGTEEILRLAATNKTKPVHFVSTIFTFAAEEGEESVAVREEDMPENSRILTSGYTQSKWVAEHIVNLARERGIPTTIYRCGRMTGDSETGACQKDDLMWRIAAGIIDLGKAPDMSGDLDMMSVDFASKGIVHLSMTEHSHNANFHLLNPNATDYDDLLAAIEKKGFTLERVSMDEWVEAVQEDAKSKGMEANSAAPLGNLFSDGHNSRGSVVYVGNKTTRLLRQADIECPEIDEEFFDKVLDYFVRSGQLQLPEKALS
ncbi:amino acid adenylation domain-containing protein [Brevibacillus gelatini]|uniref:Amino acid adenylation domain-containing protein n=1 Tax=Brevibacillus gelatini TaxID=1655277 RepID=A0A3M8B6V1_9BACL|nr:non-ribosomal peptide synthetase [Brevibacillus gelatini]RNB59090.1 amino acid adenylation domain-containing protein [Brevibacillus gelatini]